MFLRVVRRFVFQVAPEVPRECSGYKHPQPPAEPPKSTYLPVTYERIFGLRNAPLSSLSKSSVSRLPDGEKASRALVLRAVSYPNSKFEFEHGIGARNPPTGLNFSGARAAPHAARRTPRAKARAKQFSRLPGTKTSEKSWKTPPSGITKRVRSRSANEMETYEAAAEHPKG